jgi:hypothetical protein
MRLLVACLVILGFFPPHAAAADAGANLVRLLPEEFAGCKPSGEDRTFTRDTIFEYLGGAGEAYLAYGFRGLLVREYTDAARSPLVAEIYDMTGAADAFGIFSNDPNGEDAQVGSEALYGAGLLRFWKGPYFVRLLARKENAGTRDTLTSLGLKIATAITEEGTKPVILACLPRDRLKKGSVRYFHKQVSLNTYYYLADENVLRLDERTEAVLGRYKEGWSQALLVVCRYRTPADAQRAYLKFSQAYFSIKIDADGGPVIEKIENGEFAAARLAGACLILVFESSDRRSCEALLRAAESRVQNVFPWKSPAPGPRELSERQTVRRESKAFGGPGG